jgi:hypothetical protein
LASLDNRQPAFEEHKPVATGVDTSFKLLINQEMTEIREKIGMQQKNWYDLQRELANIAG